MIPAQATQQQASSKATGLLRSSTAMPTHPEHMVPRNSSELARLTLTLQSARLTRYVNRRLTTENINWTPVRYKVLSNRVQGDDDDDCGGLCFEQGGKYIGVPLDKCVFISLRLWAVVVAMDRPISMVAIATVDSR